MRAFAATAACSRAAPARPSLTLGTARAEAARASNLARGLAKLSNSRAACGGGREFEPALPQGAIPDSFLFLVFARPERFELPTLRFEA